MAAARTKQSRATLKDVAAACGVSHTAVSMALRGSREIPPGTRTRILKAAVELNYVPDESARRLKGRPSGRIAYIASRLAHGFVGQVLVGMEQRAFDTRRYFNAITPYSTWFQVRQREEVLRRVLHGGLADAVVMVSEAPSAALRADFRRLGMPLILVEEHDPRFHSVRVDNKLGAALAAEHLAGRGCRRIALVAGAVGGKGLSVNPTAVERRRGFEQGLKAARLPLERRRVVSVGYYDVASGHAALDTLLKADPDLDGIFCAAGDLVALGILQRARELGIAIPGRIRLLGYDDIDLAPLTWPALSTVRQPVQQLGAQAFDLAVKAADGLLPKPVHLLFKPELVLRESG